VAVLVNNAANDDRHRFEEVTPAYWEQRIAVNLRHIFFGSQFVTAGMKKAGGGSIINLGSVSWHSAISDLSIYETAKAGIEGLTRAMARDLGGIQHSSELRRSGRHPHAAPDEALAYTGRRSQDPRAAVPEGARRPGACHRDGPVPGLR
jgi:NADP-dependent 3-hydroxy acid dehydrogenase YdfG